MNSSLLCDRDHNNSTIIFSVKFCNHKGCPCYTFVNGRDVGIQRIKSTAEIVKAFKTTYADFISRLSKEEYCSDAKLTSKYPLLNQLVVNLKTFNKYSPEFSDDCPSFDVIKIRDGNENVELGEEEVRYCGYETDDYRCYLEALQWFDENLNSVERLISDEVTP